MKDRAPGVKSKEKLEGKQIILGAKDKEGKGWGREGEGEETFRVKRSHEKGTLRQ